ncbi:MAG: hypothetical protein IKQ99_02415 [Alphaproteobacteria bacterium]|nr:hypothetical protein [Alphaproteobacteria bacterium]
MKKLLLLSTACLLCACMSNAETISGNVVKTKNNMVTLQTEDGEKINLQTTDGTTYRKKKVYRKGSKGKIAPASNSFQPMVEEDDWVEITYTPATNEMQNAEIQEVIIYDD